MRNDIDSKLMHLVRLDLSKPDPWRRARESLKAMLASGSLTAQKHPAVPVASISFSEAPIYQLALLLVIQNHVIAHNMGRWFQKRVYLRVVAYRLFTSQEP